MSLSAKLRRAPLRIASGAYILNSGIGKLGVDDETAKKLQSTATTTYPFLDRVQPKMFARGLGVAEIAVGGALLLPMVPPAVAGAALVGFSGALLNMYWHTPGMHEENSPRPTAQGTAIAKDVWMFGIGASLVADAVLEPAHDKVVELEASVAQRRASKGRRANRKAKKAALKATAKAAKAAKAAKGKTGDSHVLGDAKDARDAYVAAARRRTEQARTRAERASDRAAARLAEARAEYGPAAMDKARTVRAAARRAAQEYGPVAAERARAAGERMRDVAEDLGPIAAERARAAGERVRDVAEDLGPIAAEKVKAARHAAQEYGVKAQEVAGEYGSKARDYAQEYGTKAKERIAG